MRRVHLILTLPSATLLTVAISNPSHIIAMLAKLTSKNQLTLPESLVALLGDAEYYDVEVENGRIVLTPVRIQQADAVRAKLEKLGISALDVSDAVQWAGTNHE